MSDIQRCSKLVVKASMSGTYARSKGAFERSFALKLVCTDLYEEAPELVTIGNKTCLVCAEA